MLSRGSGRAEPWRQSPRIALLVAAALGLLGTSPLQAAETVDAARAKAYFAEARALVAEKRYEEACPRFEASLNLVYGVGTMFNLADCWEQVGRTASALLMFRRVAATAKTNGEDERARVAAARAAALEPKVPKLRIQVASAGDIEIKRNGERVPDADLESPAFVDPGKHRVFASSPGKQPWSSELTIPRDNVLVTVTVPPLEEVSAVAPSRTVAPVAPVVSAPAPSARVDAAPARPLIFPPDSPPRSSPVLRNLGLVVGGAGVGALTAGVAFALQYRSNHQDAQAVCPQSIGCTRAQIEQHAAFVSDARRARTLSYVGFGVGAAALSSAAILLLWKVDGEPTSLSASAGLLPSGAWAAELVGRF